MDLVSAAFGGGSDKKDGEVGLDTGEGLEELTEDQIQMWKDTLGNDEFSRMYTNYA